MCFTSKKHFLSPVFHTVVVFEGVFSIQPLTSHVPVNYATTPWVFTPNSKDVEKKMINKHVSLLKELKLC